MLPSSSSKRCFSDWAMMASRSASCKYSHCLRRLCSAASRSGTVTQPSLSSVSPYCSGAWRSACEMVLLSCIRSCRIKIRRERNGLRSRVPRSLLNIQHRNLRDRPAIVGTGDLELNHRDGVRWATHDAQAAANALLLVDDHVRASAPALRTRVHRVALHHTRET